MAWMLAEVWEAIAKAQPDMPALVQGERVVSWSEMDRRGAGLAPRPPPARRGPPRPADDLGDRPREQLDHNHEEAPDEHRQQTRIDPLTNRALAVS